MFRPGLRRRPPSWRASRRSARFSSDALGHLWVREYDLPDADRPAPLWTVFDPDGHALGFVETPAGLSVLEIGADYILGLATDEIGIERIQVCALERANG